MLRKKQDHLEWLEFEIFAPYPELRAGVFLRETDPKNILPLLNCNRFATCGQPHKANVSFLPENNTEFLLECDGMISNHENEALFIRHADCQAAIFYDPKTKTIANVHAGWRGQVQNIYRETVEKFKTLVGTRPEDLLVAISPSLGPNHSEFINYKKEWPEEYWRFQHRPYYFDLWAIGKHQLTEAGVLPKNIQFAEICTYDNPQDFSSYRREGRKSGQVTAVSLTYY